jgi:hypothetical protein
MQSELVPGRQKSCMIGFCTEADVFIRLSSIPGPVPGSFADQRFHILAEVRWIGKHDGFSIFQSQAVLRDRPRRIPFVVHRLPPARALWPADYAARPAAIAFTFSEVSLSPPIVQSPLASSLIFTQVTLRMLSPSTAAIASVTFSISCCFWPGVKTSRMT